MVSGHYYSTGRPIRGESLAGDEPISDVAYDLAVFYHNVVCDDNCAQGLTWGYYEDVNHRGITDVEMVTETLVLAGFSVRKGWRF